MTYQLYELPDRSLTVHLVTPVILGAGLQFRLETCQTLVVRVARIESESLFVSVEVHGLFLGFRSRRDRSAVDVDDKSIRS